MNIYLVLLAELAFTATLRAGQQGFELGKADTDQLDRFLQHMSRIA